MNRILFILFLYICSCSATNNVCKMSFHKYNNYATHWNSTDCDRIANVFNYYQKNEYNCKFEEVFSLGGKSNTMVVDYNYAQTEYPYQLFTNIQFWKDRIIPTIDVGCGGRITVNDFNANVSFCSDTRLQTCDYVLPNNVCLSPPPPFPFPPIPPMPNPPNSPSPPNPPLPVPPLPPVPPTPPSPTPPPPPPFQCFISYMLQQDRSNMLPSCMIFDNIIKIITDKTIMTSCYKTNNTISLYGVFDIDTDTQCNISFRKDLIIDIFSMICGDSFEFMNYANGNRSLIQSTKCPPPPPVPPTPPPPPPPRPPIPPTPPSPPSPPPFPSPNPPNPPFPPPNPTKTIEFITYNDDCDINEDEVKNMMMNILYLRNQDIQVINVIKLAKSIFEIEINIDFDETFLGFPVVIQYIAFSMRKPCIKTIVF